MAVSVFDPPVRHHASPPGVGIVETEGLTKNPNILKVRSVLGQTRAHAKIETADLAAALKGTQRREERELCEQLRLQPRRLAEYRRRLLAELKPLGSSVT
jgi:hypothetical protein